MKDKIFTYKNMTYKTCPNVYEPAEDTFLLIDNLQLKKGINVLEIGCGTGLVSLFASLNSNSVTCVDIKKYALDCCSNNILLNKKENMKVIYSNLFSAFNDEKFDLILFNTPYLPVEDNELEDEYSLSWDGGKDGREVIDKFINKVGDYLTSNGTVQLVQSSLSNCQASLDLLKENGFSNLNTTSIHIFFEDIILISASR